MSWFISSPKLSEARNASATETRARMVDKIAAIRPSASSSASCFSPTTMLASATWDLIWTSTRVNAVCKLACVAGSAKALSHTFFVLFPVAAVPTEAASELLRFLLAVVVVVQPSLASSSRSGMVTSDFSKGTLPKTTLDAEALGTPAPPPTAANTLESKPAMLEDNALSSCSIATSVGFLFCL
eukprot:7730247-Lingulodinium_polyedra.AAC.1